MLRFEFPKSMPLLVVLAAVLVGLAGCIGNNVPIAPVEASEGTSDAHAVASNTADAWFDWQGKTPVDVYVCLPVVSCQGHEVESTDWAEPLPLGDQATGVALTLTWEPVDETIGPMVFRLDRVPAAGGVAENYVNLVSSVSPIEMTFDGIVLPAGESLRVSVWPEAKVGGPVPVYIDLAEQPFHVAGGVFAAP